MSLPGESAGHAARRGDPGHSGPGEELGEGGPVLGRTEQPRGLETALLPPQDREQSLLGQTLHQHIAVEGGELQLPVLPQGEGAAPAGKQGAGQPVGGVLQPGLPSVQAPLPLLPKGSTEAVRCPLQQGDPAPAEGLPLPEGVRVQKDDLAGGAGAVLPSSV